MLIQATSVIKYLSIHQGKKVDRAIGAIIKNMSYYFGMVFQNKRLQKTLQIPKKRLRSGQRTS